MRPDLAKQFEAKVGMSCEEFFGKNEYTHKRSGRKVVEDYFPFHSQAFQENLIHAENVGGDIDKVTGKRVTFAFFPIRWTRGDGCIIRLVAMLDKTGEYRIETGA